MPAFSQANRRGCESFLPALYCGLLIAGLGLASTAFAAGGGSGGGGGGGGGGGVGGGSTADASRTMGGDSGASGAARKMNRSDLTTCAPGMAWDTRRRKCVMRHSGALTDPDLTEYAYALAKVDRYQEAIDVLDLLDDPNTPRALNYRGYATRKLGRTDEGIAYYLKSIGLDPNYPQVREYLGEAYVIQGKYDLAKEQLSSIEKICSKDCEYYDDLAQALAQAHAL
jgi:tetratricopeptide (TPR) repeat protein